MKDKYSEQWERLGESDPYWAVLTDPDKRGGKWNITEFFNTGEEEIANVLLKVKGLGLEITYGIALDFGCGVGRLSRALANEFRRVIAVDVASSMLNEARKANHQIANIDFFHNTAEDLGLFSENTIDFLYSNIVLQHMPNYRQFIFIREFCRVLRPGGILVIQTPSKYNLKSWKGWLYLIAGNNILNMVRRVKYGPAGVMEVHALPKNVVLETLNQKGMNIIHVERYDSAGPAFESYMYFAKKS